MTYCLGIVTHEGLVLASDSRTNAGHDQVNICRKMHTFVQPGERAFAVLTSGSLSLTQSVITLLRSAFENGEGLAKAENLYSAARIIGDCVRRVSDMDRAALERDEYNFNIHLLLGGQVGNEPPESIFNLSAGESDHRDGRFALPAARRCKCGRPILDRGVVFSQTSLDTAAKYALLSIDSTMRSNVTVGPPIDLIVYPRDTLRFDHWRRFAEFDPELLEIHRRWERSLRKTVEELPNIHFEIPVSAPG